MDSYKTDCFELINEFKSGNISMDWNTIFEDTELQNALNEGINDAIHHIAFLSDIDESKKIDLIGKLAYAQARLAIALTFKDKNAFVSQGAKLEKTISELISSGSWFKTAQANFDLLDQLSEENFDITKASDLAPKLVPVLLLLSVIAIISGETEDESCAESCDEDECCDEE